MRGMSGVAERREKGAERRAPASGKGREGRGVREGGAGACPRDHTGKLGRAAPGLVPHHPDGGV